jgi:hypothetical protein
MKKLLGSTLALALLVPAGAHAELLKNLKVGGSLEVNAVSANNVTDFNTAAYDHVDTIQTRLMLNADWDLLDDVHAKVTLNKNNRTYGNATGENLNTIQSNVTAEQANIKIDKLFGGLDTTLGRQFYGDAGDLVIYFGPRNDYGLTVTALDGGRFDWNGENWGLTALVAKEAGASTLTTGKDSGDKNLMGLVVHAMPMEGVSGSVFVYGQNTINSGSQTNTGVIGNDHLYVAGLKAKATMGGAWVKAEIAKDFGENRTVTTNGAYTLAGNYTGWAGKVNVGYKADVQNVGALAGWLEGGVGSAGQTTNRNFTAIAGDYRPGGIYGRFWSGANTTKLGNTSLGNLDNGSLSNRVIVGAGVKATPSMLEKLTVGLSVWNYRAQNETALNIGSNPGPKGNVILGTEYDLDLGWKHSENVMVNAGVGDLQPGNAVRVTNGGAVSPVTACYADFSVKF